MIIVKGEMINETVNYVTIKTKASVPILIKLQVDFNTSIFL